MMMLLGKWRGYRFQHVFRCQEQSNAKDRQGHSIMAALWRNEGNHQQLPGGAPIILFYRDIFMGQPR